jgi:hypothetical protein
MFYESHACRHWYRREYAVIKFLRGTTVFFGFIYQLEKWGDFHHWRKQVQGPDSNSKANSEE